jgi:hypothetical protein
MKRWIRRRKLGFHVFGKDSSMLLDVAFLNGTVSELTVDSLSKNFSKARPRIGALPITRVPELWSRLRSNTPSKS